jgi:putative endonuclease
MKSMETTKDFTVYVLYSKAYAKIYVGYTSNLAERIKSHNELGKKGFTVKYRPWEIVYTESFEKKSEAMRREKALKSSRGRRFIWEELVKG